MLQTEAQVIEIAAFPAGGSSASASQFSIDRNQVQHRASRTQLDEAEIIASAFDRAAKDSAVEIDHPVDARNPQDDMIDLANSDALRRPHRRQPCS
jgi:hypothetical protein